MRCSRTVRWCFNTPTSPLPDHFEDPPQLSQSLEFLEETPTGPRAELVEMALIISFKKRDSEKDFIFVSNNVTNSLCINMSTSSISMREKKILMAMNQRFLAIKMCDLVDIFIYR